MAVTPFAFVGILLLSSSTTVWPAQAGLNSYRPQLVRNQGVHHRIQWAGKTHKHKEIRLGSNPLTANRPWLVGRTPTWSPDPHSEFRLEPREYGTGLATHSGAKELRLPPAEGIRLVEIRSNLWKQTL
jgi:hypothetical protein